MKKEIDFIETYSKDKRKSIETIYNSLSKLKKGKWIKTKLYTQKIEIGGKKFFLPILSFKTKKKGSALWIISGIHGEEPAGPNAIIKNINLLNRLSKEIPIILLPLCNPKGYALNWRYPDMKRPKKNRYGKSVGDSDHILPNQKDTSKPRIKKPVCKESDKITKFILKNFEKYPPALVLDFHEDKNSGGCYIYSQGKLKENDPIAKEVVKILRKKKFQMVQKGKTMFDQEISDGIVSEVNDGSIDELLASKEIIKGKKINGPNAKSVIVVETTSIRVPLKKRVNAHSTILKNSKKFYEIAKTIKLESSKREIV
jgi:predicted deacylase